MKKRIDYIVIAKKTRMERVTMKLCNQRVLVIGIDGATWDLIKPWADKGKLPTLRELMENGVWGHLESTIPPWTIPAWESMATGKNPKRLGYATFMVKNRYKFVPHIFKHKQQKMIWDMISDAGYKVVIANVPNIYSPQRINGCIISGWLCIDKNNLTYPSNLVDELNECCNGYEVDIFDVDLKEGKITSSPNDREYIKCCEELLEKHFLAFKYILQKYQWNFGFIVFVTPDRIQHKYWNSRILFNHYRKIDSKLKEIFEIIDEKTVVFIVSDHGFGPVRYVLNINEFLIKENYLKIKENYRIFATSKLLQTLLHILTKKPKLLSIVKNLVNILPYLKKKFALISFEKMDIDWNSTKAFAYGVWGDIYLNVRGREPNGIVDPSEYDSLREEIIEKIRSLEYKGEKLRIQIFKKEDVYPNADLLDNLPDLVVLPTEDGIQLINPTVGIGDVIIELKDGRGNHRLNGIFLAYGCGIKKGYKIEAKIYDVAPTILHIFGLPIPSDMDGRVLMEIFEPNSEFAKKEPKFVSPSYYAKEDEKLKKAIKNLKLRRRI